MSDPIDRLRAAGVDNPRLDARVLKEHAKNNPPLEGGSKFAQQISGRGEAASTDPSPKNPSDFSTLPQGEGRLREEGGIAEQFEKLLDRRIAREPVAYITGHKEFWSLDFEVGPGVLVPRPDTETLIEEMLKSFPDRAAPLDIVDLGSGSGCLLVAALHEYPNARGRGIDSSPDAMTWTQRNIARHGLGGRASADLADWADVTGIWDVILCNPPYVRSGDIAGLAPEVRLYEPLAALDGGADGLDAYRALAPRIANLLKPLGLAFLEIGAGQEGAAVEILVSAGLKIVRQAKDLAGLVRCIVTGL